MTYPPGHFKNIYYFFSQSLPSYWKENELSRNLSNFIVFPFFLLFLIDLQNISFSIIFYLYNITVKLKNKGMETERLSLSPDEEAKRENPYLVPRSQW